MKPAIAGKIETTSYMLVVFIIYSINRQAYAWRVRFKA
jgi:hypothetical protein